MSVAGSDNSAGAGAQADLKTFGALGTYGLTCLTCVVAEVPGKVESIFPLPPKMVADQIRMSLGAFPVAAAKTGMLYSREIIEAVCDEFMRHPGILLVVDPVMVASSGDPLLKDDAVEAYKSRLFGMAHLITPNLDEAAALVGHPIRTEDAMREAGVCLQREAGTSVLLKGGHLEGPEAVDLLFEGERIHEFRAPFLRGVSTHGTGCTYSAAIAAGLAIGLKLPDAVRRAKTYVTHAITRHLSWKGLEGRIQALDHFAPL